MTLREKDVDKDGRINIKEYLGDIFEQPTSEYYITEQNRFNNDYDKNGDGFLTGTELRDWLVPDIRETALAEAKHLIEGSDSDADGKLSIDEIVNAYALFAGSDATNYGEHMLNLNHEEL
jgi:Ca2+-binding EF-hand superfamily protein